MLKFVILTVFIAISNCLVCPPNSSQSGGSTCSTGSTNPSILNNQCCCNFGFQANSNATLCVTAASLVCPGNSSQRGNSPCSTGSPNPAVLNDQCCCFFGFEANTLRTGCVPVGTIQTTCPQFSSAQGTGSCATGTTQIAGQCCCWYGYVLNANGNACIPSSTIPEVPICSSVITGGCTRYVRGYDITGVTNFVSLTVQNGIHTPCDCLNKCKAVFNTCAAWVWKFTDTTGFRTCTLYSNFNLPPTVTLGFSTGTSVNSGVIGQNPQTGGLVPHCTLNGLNNGTVDTGCISGELWALDNGNFYC